MTINVRDFDGTPLAGVHIGDTAAENLATYLNDIEAVDDAAQAVGAIRSKPTVRVATTVALAAYTRTGNTILADAVGAIGAIDGITLVAGDLLLLKNGASGVDNGPYEVIAVGDGSTKFELERTELTDTSAEMTPGSDVYVSEGNANGDKTFELTTNAPITLNSTSLTWRQRNASGLIAKLTLAALSQHTGGTASSEAAFTALTLLPQYLNTVRRKVKYRARLVVTGANSTDTLRIRARLGGLTGTLIADVAAYDTTANDVINIEGEILLTTAGSSGVFDASSRSARTGSTSFAKNTDVLAGSVDATASQDLTLTALFSTNNVGNIVQLRDFECEVWEA